MLNLVAARSPVFNAMFEHEMEESKKVCNRLESDCFPIWKQIYFPVFFFFNVIKMEYSTLNRQFLKAERGGLETFWVKQTHCSKQIIQIVLS